MTDSLPAKRYTEEDIAERRALYVLCSSFLVAVALAAVFSGSVLAPLTSVPVALVGGSIAGWLLCR